MKLALCLKEGVQEAPLDGRFGRSAYFCIYDTDSGKASVFENSAKDASGGAGSLAVQQLIDRGAEILIAPEVGPQALDALQQMGIPAFRQGTCTRLVDAVEAWKAGTLEKVEKATIKGLHRA